MRCFAAPVDMIALVVTLYTDGGQKLECTGAEIAVMVLMFLPAGRTRIRYREGRQLSSW